MSIVTHAPNKDYDEGFESTFGKRCFYCRKVMQREVVTDTEWQAAEHTACVPQEQA